MSDIAIKVENLSKVYKLYDNPLDRLKESLHPFRKKYHKDFYALKDVSFEVKKGETVGIIGRNGSGKSTLLKLITGVLTPSSGNITVNGKISALLELGAGFNPEFTGIENVYFNSTLMGYTKEEIDAKLDDILSFADIGDFIYQPVKTYSSGMFVRLAFAVAINVDPEILIVDEALAVGDMRFQQKCIRRINSFRENGKNILFVSQDTGSINNFCDKAMWLHNGGIREYGETEPITKRYFSYMAYGLEVVRQSQNQKYSNGKDSSEDMRIEWDDVSHCESFGDGGAKITHVALYDGETGEKIGALEGGEKIRFYVKISVIRDIENPIVGFMLKDRLGNAVTGANSFVYRNTSQIGEFKRDQIKIIMFEFKVPHFGNGRYLLSPAIAEGTQQNHIQLHWVNDAIEISMQSSSEIAFVGWLYCSEDMVIAEVSN